MNDTNCSNPFDDWYEAEKGSSDEFELELIIDEPDVDDVEYDDMTSGYED